MGSQVEPSTGGLTAPVDAADIADGSVSSTEFQYLDGVTSDLQTQLASKVDISGTPSAGNYARWSDADTLEARTTAQVLSDIGALASGSGVERESGNWTLASYAKALKIAAGQVLRWASNGTSELTSAGIRQTTNSLQLIASYDSGGSGAPDGAAASQAVIASIDLLNYLITLNATLAASLAGNMKLDDLATPDDNTDLNASSTRHGLLPKLSNVATEFLTGTGTWATPKPDISGTPVANRIATWSDADTLQGGAAALSVAGALSGVTTLGMSSHIVQSSDTYGMISDTSDGSDTKRIRIAGGGANTTTRGGFIEVAGNEHTNTGRVALVAGNVTGAKVDILTADTSRIAISHDGTLTIHATTLADLRDQVIRTGYYAVAWTATPATGYLNADGSAVSRATYAALFAVIGTTFGVGDGSTTFNLPDTTGLNANDIFLHIKT